jgi:hypothetical protein
LPIDCAGAFATQARQSFLPCQQHAVTDVHEPGMLGHGPTNVRRHVDDGVGNPLDDLFLLAPRESERRRDEIRQALARLPRLLAHERDAGRTG